MNQGRMKTGGANVASRLGCARLRVIMMILAFAAPQLGFSAISVHEAAMKKLHITDDRVPGELIIKLKPSAPGRSATASVMASLQKKLGVNSIVSMTPFHTDHSLHVLKLAQDKNLHAAMVALNAEPSIEYAEPNYRVHSLEVGVPNDPDLPKLWGLKNTGQVDAQGQTGIAGSDINVFPVWAEGITGRRSVVVAVVDTGIDWTHPDLAANLYTNPGESGDKAKNGVDDDGNGFIDDVHGWNFVNNTANSVDDQGHGSHCSGTIGAVGNNGIGVAGINWEVSLMPVKFLDDQGSGTLQGAVDAVNYARMMKVNVMSNSWGGGGFSQALHDAIDATRAAGILFVAAAGNDGANNDETATYPAGFDSDNIVAVAATDNRDIIADFSNFGTKTVHVAAPGVKVYSSSKNGGYETMSGTSMATPHVAGVAALLLSAHPELSYADLKTRLITTSQPVRGLKRKVAAHGRVDAYNALHGIVVPSHDPDERLWQHSAGQIESEHPYANSSNIAYTIHVQDAKYVRVHFDKYDLENRFDTIAIEDGKGTPIDLITGAGSDYTSEYVEGDTIVIHLKSDDSVNKWGFHIDKVQYILPTDVIPTPTPSPTPTEQPSPAPSTTPDPAPSATATPSPAPTPSPTATQSPTPSPGSIRVQVRVLKKK